MWFLIKAAFWIGLVVLFIPESDDPKLAGSPRVSTVEALGVLNAAVNDAKGFCERNPGACATGAVAVQNFGYKAQNATKMLHEFISQKVDESRNLVPPPAAGRSGPDAARDAQAQAPVAQRMADSKKRG